MPASKRTRAANVATVWLIEGPKRMSEASAESW
jgi:hypothetical protein